MKKKKKSYNQEASIRGALRRAFSSSPLVREVLDESRQEFPRYKNDGKRHKRNWVKRECEVCHQWVSSGNISVDHIDPVISVDDGKQDWNTFVDRLWCNTSGKANLQRICHSCHDKKTKEERIARLTIKYTRELDEIEANIKNYEPKVLKKILSKYIAKKKTQELIPVVERALELKNQITS